MKWVHWAKVLSRNSVCVLVIGVVGLAKIASAAPPSYLPSSFKGVSENQKKKAASRWTIEDWFSQKKRLQWMDYWLAMNTSPVDFEFAIGGDQWGYQENSDLTPTEKVEGLGRRGDISLYYRIVGITGEWEKLSDDFTWTGGHLDLRVMGTSLQSTQLTIYYGIRHLNATDSNEQMDQQFAGATMTVYLFPLLGIEGLYRQNFRASKKDLREEEGSRWGYGAFLEWGVLRLYANWLIEISRVSSLPTNASTVTTTRKGLDVGLRLYF